MLGAAVTIVVIGALVFLYVRGGGPSAQPAAVTSGAGPAATAVPFTKLVQGTQSSISARTNYVITSPTQLDELWKTIGATGTPPTVDFNTHAVLAVFAGKESAATIAVAKIEDTNARMVSIVIAKPTGACAQSVPAATPYELVAVASTTLPLTHSDTTETVPCNQ